MGFTNKYPFTFPHDNRIKVILSDDCEDNIIPHSLAKRLSQNPEARSFCYYKNGAECFMHESILEGDPKKEVVG